MSCPYMSFVFAEFTSTHSPASAYMLPIRLMLKNFLPYRAPDEVKFDGIHLACLTGANGAGKSSILDAITWVLWGSARAKRDEDLIHQGQDDMYVQLDFEQEGNIYRVIRRRSRSKRGSSTGSVDLFVIRKDGQPVMMSEPNMRATDEKIVRLLRLDYETFVHSAFLQQGKADAFTTQAPAKRKQILADILGLEAWAKYEDQVKETLKQIDKDLAYCETRIKEINTELARKPALESEQADAIRAHGEARTLLQDAQARLDQIKDAPAALRNAQANRGERERRQREYQRDLQELRTDIPAQQRSIAQYESITAMKDQIEGGYGVLQAARETDQSLNLKLENLRDLDQRRTDLTNQLSAAQARLETELETLLANQIELQRMIDTDPSADLESLQAEVAALHALEVDRDDLVQAETTLRETRASLKTQLQAIEDMGKEMRERLETLQSTDAALCPLCGQPLTLDHRTALIAQLNADIETHRTLWVKHKEDIATIDHNLKQMKTTLQGIETSLKQLPNLLERAGKLQAQTDTATQAVFRLNEEQSRITQLNTLLMQAIFAPDIRKTLTDLDAEEEALGYDKGTHAATRRSLEEYRQYEQLKTQLAIALERVPGLRSALDGMVTRQERLQLALIEVTQAIKELDIEITKLQVQANEYAQREQEVRVYHTRERTAYERLVNIQQALSSLESQAVRKIELEKRQTEFRHQQGIYKELKDAFGRNGIPAMIIETAIPELEITANELLSRMTDGRMSLRLTTQKEKVTGGVAETLDIDISDELGTRNYEMYSGGEAFRINFALRIALSQMLARRAGAHLRTLFIDEGFGTQDDTGRNKLVEAINAIQDEFDLILVITHIDELRDNFPVHIMIDKTVSGSRISVR